MNEFRIAWRGLDLFDSIEEEGQTLTARACYRIACEVVSAIRRAIEGHVPEPWQDDSWARLDFPHLGQTVRCTIGMEAENEFSVRVDCEQGLIRWLTARSPPPIKVESVEVVRQALNENTRIELLTKDRAAEGS